MSKYTCRENLEILENKIQSIRNQNRKMDYEKIFKGLKKDVDNLFIDNQKQLPKNDLNILNYIIEKNIYDINKIY